MSAATIYLDDISGVGSTLRHREKRPLENYLKIILL